MGRFERHINKGEKLVIGGEEFYLKAIGTEFIPYFMKIAKSFSGAKPDSSMDDVLKNIDDAGLNALKTVIDKTLEISFPEEAVEDRRLFGMQHMTELLPLIIELNQPVTPDSERLKMLEKRKNEPTG